MDVFVFIQYALANLIWPGLMSEKMNAVRILIPFQELFNIHIEKVDDEYVAAWVDAKGNARVRGFGKHPIMALQDLNSNLL